ncbi:hypothetical protein H7Y40_01005 [Pedobacter sp.]|nr:hypothetical protein [Candidatus Saccharibacteria bacterium]
MARLPQPGGDENTWGTILNDFLAAAHNLDGTLKNATINPTALNTGTPATGQVLSYDGTGFSWSTPSGSGSVPDASSSVKGLVQLTGDLGGTAANPTVPGLASKADLSVLSSHTSNTANPHTVTKAQVGLANVDNTSDINKPVSTAAQTALNLKADSVDVYTQGQVDTALSTKANTSHTHTVIQISDSTAVGRSVIAAVDATSARSAIGAGTSNLILGTTSVTAKAGDYAPTKTDIGLANVDNTSDANKPVSTATQTALNLKANLVSPTFTGTVTVPAPTNNTDAATKNYVDTTAGAGTPDANSTTKGKLQLTGDLGGTAASPTVPGLAGKASTVHVHDTSDITSGAFPVGRIGTGTPAADTYVDGATGAWTTLPSSGPHAASHGSVGGDPVTLAESQITNLTTDLAGKAATVHTHAAGDLVSGTISTTRLPSATNAIKGIIMLAGDLAGNANVPTVPGLANKADKVLTLNAQVGTTYTLVLADASGFITLTNASAVTLTIPTNATVALPVGTQIMLAQLGLGQVTVAGSGGVTVNGQPGLKTAAQYARASLVKLSTDTWLLGGQLSA